MDNELELDKLATVDDLAKTILANKKVKLSSEELSNCPFLKSTSRRKKAFEEHPLFGHGKSVSFVYTDEGELKLELTPEQKKELKEWNVKVKKEEIEEDFK